MSEWVDVKDRLPKDSEYVLTYSKIYRLPVRVGFYSEESKMWYPSSLMYVTHWQKLPEKPE